MTYADYFYSILQNSIDRLFYVSTTITPVDDRFWRDMPRRPLKWGPAKLPI